MHSYHNTMVCSISVHRILPKPEGSDFLEQTDITNKLVKKAIRGNVDAYGKLFEIYKDYLYRTAFTAMKNEDAAMDAVSDCMLNGFRSIHSLKTPEYFKTWITKILYNAINDYYRKNTLTEPFTDFEFPATEENVSREEQLDLYRAIDLLPENHKNVVILKYFNDLKINEIAYVMNIPEGSVKAYLSRAKEELRNILIA